MAEENIHNVNGRTIDIMTVIGMICSFAMIITAIVLGGSPESFINPPSILIVIGGTLAITTVCFSFSEIGSTVKVISKTMFRNTQEPFDAAYKALQVAEISHKQGTLMVIDGIPGEEVEHILRCDLQSKVIRHGQSASMFRKIAKFAPAMGLIGTLIGLVQMLDNLQDPTTIGPAMAVALLTTFYGAVLANMVFLPLASKLEQNSSQEDLIHQVFLLTAASIGRLEMLLNSILQPSQRVQYFD